MKGFTRERVPLWIINCSLLWMAFFKLQQSYFNEHDGSYYGALAIAMSCVTTTLPTAQGVAKR